MNMQMICRQHVGTVSMDPADAERLLDDEALKKKEPESIRKKERPTDKGVAWLVNTQYISPFSLESAKQVRTMSQKHREVYGHLQKSFQSEHMFRRKRAVVK